MKETNGFHMQDQNYSQYNAGFTKNPMASRNVQTNSTSHAQYNNVSTRFKHIVTGAVSSTNYDSTKGKCHIIFVWTSRIQGRKSAADCYINGMAEM